MNTKNLVLLRGIPGSGKSTIASLFSNAINVCADDYFINEGKYIFDKSQLSNAHQWCQDVVNNLMVEGKDIVVHNTFTTIDEMQPYFNMANEFGYMIHTMVVENRHNSESIHNVPQDTLNRMVSRFDIQLAPKKTVYDTLVQVKDYGDLKFHKYRRNVFYKNLWDKDPRIIDARGLVLDSDGNVVQYPFTKIFNFHENGTIIDRDEQVLAVKKINGFMAAVTLYNNEILVSTTGSLDSPFVEYAKQILPMDKIKPFLSENITYCFEIVHPDDPHIIHEQIGAYLIGGRVKQIGSPQLNIDELVKTANDMGVYPPEYFYDIFGNVVKMAKKVYHEGFVVYGKNTVLKIKSPYYLTHKFIARCKDVSKLFSKNYKQYVDEEFYNLIEKLQTDYTEQEFKNMHEQERLNIIRSYAEVVYE